ncbi:hypothetical protein LR48_Vigan04g097700 [Vigna angularis]|uniref:Putative plant transposon protein domain-containing protein n=1 Tax=Phaseolus angularis TaxID=3914 RepID=A0A0L9UE09_PHAAN|nr:hypothetical protein LR48_Vigan04g097700 [Vigna angularis]
MTSSLGKRIKSIGFKRKDKELERSYSNKFLSRKHERFFNIVQDRRLLIERKAGLILDFAPQFGEQFENRNWERLAPYPAPANIVVVKEFYTNARRLSDYPAEEYMSYVRGHIIRYDPDSINRCLNTEWAGEQCQLALSMEEGADFVDVESMLCVLGGHFQRNRNVVVVNIMRVDLTPLAKNWMAFSHANIQPYSHSIHRGHVATTDMIIGMYDTSPGHRWTMDEFNDVVAWPEEQAQASEAGVTEALAMDDDEDEDDEFEDAEDEGEEEDSDDNMG